MTEMKLPPKEHNNCGTEDCCGQCATANLGPDWNLIAVNQWYKTFINNKTGESKRIKTYEDSD